jgi:hypothetical protein
MANCSGIIRAERRLILGGGMASGGRGFVNDAWSAIHPQASFSEANMPK